MASGFYAEAPSNLGDLTKQLARFYGWSPSEAEDLTPAELYEWTEGANKMLKANK